MVPKSWKFFIFCFCFKVSKEWSNNEITNGKTYTNSCFFTQNTCIHSHIQQQEVRVLWVEKLVEISTRLYLNLKLK